MKIITRYVWKTLLGTILLSMFLVFGIDLIFSFVSEVRYLGKGDYTFWHMIIFNLLSMPQTIYQMFPMASLVGTLMGLGVLASHSELIVIRAAGISINQIMGMVIKLSFILAFFAWCLGEWVAPTTDKIAQNQKAVVLSGGQTLKTEHGVWLRDNNKFINIRSVDVGGHLEGIISYEFDKDFSLQKASKASYADYIGDHWVLYDVKVTTFLEDKLQTQHYPQMDWQSTIDPNILRILGTKYLDELSLVGLWKTLQYRKKNELDYRPYQLALWQKIVQPFAIMVMMFLAIPFVFGPLRSSTQGLKLVIGMVVGFLFHTVNDLFGPLTLVYQLHPIIGACLPTLVFFGLGCYALKRWQHT